MYRKQRRTLATRYLLRYQQNPSMSQNERKLLSLIDNGRINSPVGQQADVCWRNCRTSSLSPFRKDIFSQAMDRTNVKLEVWLQVWGAAPLTAAAACSFKVLESGTNKEHSAKTFFLPSYDISTGICKRWRTEKTKRWRLVRAGLGLRGFVGFHCNTESACFQYSSS